MPHIHEFLLLAELPALGKILARALGNRANTYRWARKTRSRNVRLNEQKERLLSL